MWPPGQGTFRDEPLPNLKQRKSPNEINHSVSGHRNTRAGPVAISQSAKLAGAHYAGRIQASHFARCIQVVHVTSFIQAVHIVDVIYGDQLAPRIGITRCIRAAHRKD